MRISRRQPWFISFSHHVLFLSCSHRHAAVGFSWPGTVDGCYAGEIHMMALQVTDSTHDGGGGTGWKAAFWTSLCFGGKGTIEQRLMRRSAPVHANETKTKSIFLMSQRMWGITPTSAGLHPSPLQAWFAQRVAFWLILGIHIHEARRGGGGNLQYSCLIAVRSEMHLQSLKKGNNSVWLNLNKHQTSQSEQLLNRCCFLGEIPPAASFCCCSFFFFFFLSFCCPLVWAALLLLRVN